MTFKKDTVVLTCIEVKIPFLIAFLLPILATIVKHACNYCVTIARFMRISAHVTFAAVSFHRNLRSTSVYSFW